MNKRSTTNEISTNIRMREGPAEKPTSSKSTHDIRQPNTVHIILNINMQTHVMYLELALALHPLGRVGDDLVCEEVEGVEHHALGIARVDGRDDGGRRRISGGGSVRASGHRCLRFDECVVFFWRRFASKVLLYVFRAFLCQLSMSMSRCRRHLFSHNEEYDRPP